MELGFRASKNVWVVQSFGKGRFMGIFFQGSLPVIFPGIFPAWALLFKIEGI